MANGKVQRLVVFQCDLPINDSMLKAIVCNAIKTQTVYDKDSTPGKLLEQMAKTLKVGSIQIKP